MAMAPVQQPEKSYQRFPAVSRMISEINVETDIRVRIVGKITDIVPDGFVISDLQNTQAEVRFENPGIIQAGKLVRIFCRVIPLEQGFELHGELVQDASALDMTTYAKVFSIPPAG